MDKQINEIFYILSFLLVAGFSSGIYFSYRLYKEKDRNKKIKFYTCLFVIPLLIGFLSWITPDYKLLVEKIGERLADTWSTIGLVAMTYQAPALISLIILIVFRKFEKRWLAVIFVFTMAILFVVVRFTQALIR